MIKSHVVRAQRKSPRKKMDGEKCGMLTVVSYSHSDKTQGAMWNCICECGNEKVVLGKNLRSGHTVSCGCFLKKKRSLFPFAADEIMRKSYPDGGTRAVIAEIHKKCGMRFRSKQIQSRVRVLGIKYNHRTAPKKPELNRAIGSLDHDESLIDHESSQWNDLVKKMPATDKQLISKSKWFDSQRS